MRPTIGDLRQMRRVGAVETADDHQKIKRLVKKISQRVLPVLRRTADRVETFETLEYPRFAETVLSGFSQ